MLQPTGLYAELTELCGTDWGPVHTNAFSFENAYLFIRFRLPSTLIRSKTEVYVCENGGFRKRSLEWRFLKTEVQRLCVDGRKRRFSKTEVQRLCVDGWKRRFSKTITSLTLACPSYKNKTDVFLSVFGGQVWTVENAAKTLVCTKNFLSVFKKQKTEVFENALVWTGPEWSTNVKFFRMGDRGFTDLATK